MAVNRRIQGAQFSKQPIKRVMLLQGAMEAWYPYGAEQYFRSKMSRPDALTLAAGTALENTHITWPPRVLSLRSALGLTGTPPRMTYRQLFEQTIGRAAKPFVYKSIYHVVMTTPPLTLAAAVTIVNPVPMDLVHGADAATMTAMRSRQTNSKHLCYLSRGEVAHLLKQPSVTVMCPDDVERPLSGVIGIPDMVRSRRSLCCLLRDIAMQFNPRTIIRAHCRSMSAADARSDASVAKLRRLTLLDNDRLLPALIRQLSGRPDDE